MTSEETKPGILAILAHPDDETFGIGGTLALYASLGYPVFLACATRGEAGEMDSRFLIDGKTIAEVREAELRCACKELGIQAVELMDYRDSGMPGMEENAHPLAFVNISEEEMISTILQMLDRIRPGIVITFDSIGGYPHPDHIRLHQLVTTSFKEWVSINRKVGDDPLPRLFYYTISRRIIRWMVKLYPWIGKDPKRTGINKDVDLTVIADHPNRIQARIDYRKVKDTRIRACKCYQSQGGDQLNKGAAGLLRGWENGFEYFEQAYPAPDHEKLLKDLFE